MLKVTVVKPTKVRDVKLTAEIPAGTVFSGELSILNESFTPIGTFLRTNEGVVILRVVQAPIHISWYFKSVFTLDCVVRDYHEHKDTELIVRD